MIVPEAVVLSLSRLYGPSKRLEKGIRRNSERSMRKMSLDFGMCPKSMITIVRKKLKMVPYSMQKAAFLTEKNTVLRMQKGRKLQIGTHRSTPFTDEKLFTVEVNKNGQNNKIIA
uniref:Uncharacterized protein n=1 Tax=Caenorhabditis japonica TaxID=281687 RepID=A0A8R1E576_CAEJA